MESIWRRSRDDNTEAPLVARFVEAIDNRFAHLERTLLEAIERLAAESKRGFEFMAVIEPPDLERSISSSLTIDIPTQHPYRPIAQIVTNTSVNSYVSAMVTCTPTQPLQSPTQQSPIDIETIGADLEVKSEEVQEECGESVGDDKDEARTPQVEIITVSLYKEEAIKVYGSLCDGDFVSHTPCSSTHSMEGVLVGMPSRGSRLVILLGLEEMSWDRLGPNIDQQCCIQFLFHSHRRHQADDPDVPPRFPFDRG
ncbi:uncharacterized protein LOC143861182 [Tasmannia lanceolata]|uniref:uncharacterized protein LOC143861182 n=1 Tax=Tasmannia lanceolata TaxID=3420 RepID=UPI00406362B4